MQTREELVEEALATLQGATDGLPTPPDAAPTFSELGGQLIITHTHEAHRRIALELESIRLAPGRRTASVMTATYAATGGTFTASIASWLARSKRQHRLRHGQCLHCGYDLRATPTHCPECGHAPANATTPTVAKADPPTPAIARGVVLFHSRLLVRAENLQRAVLEDVGRGSPRHSLRHQQLNEMSG